MDREKTRERCRAWYERNAETVKAKNKAKYWADVETSRAWQRRYGMVYREKHRDEINAKEREYYAAHRDEILARRREAYHKKKESAQRAGNE